MAEEKEVEKIKEICEECGSENIFDCVYEGRMANLCSTCARMNGAVILKKPTTEQLSRMEEENSLGKRVKSWRKRREAEQPASLETLRRRKLEIEKDRQRKNEQLMKREIEEAKSIIDFRSKDVTIGQLKQIHQKELHHKEFQHPKSEAEQRIKQTQQTELELDEFKQEVEHAKQEEKLDEELNVPSPSESGTVETTEPESNSN